MKYIKYFLLIVAFLNILCGGLIGFRVIEPTIFGTTVTYLVLGWMFLIDAKRIEM